MIKRLCKIVSPGAVYFDSQAMQKHTCCRRSVAIAALLFYLLLNSSGASVDTGGREHLLRNWIRHYHIIEVQDRKPPNPCAGCSMDRRC